MKRPDYGMILVATVVLTCVLILAYVAGVFTGGWH